MGDTVTISVPTLQEVARLAGVSASTVGLVLNGRGDKLRISKATQNRIRDAAKQLNYEPNTMARGLSGKSTKSLGIIWSLSGPHDSGSSVQQIVQHAYRRGYTAHIAETLAEMDTMKATLWDLYRRGVDGVIIQMAFMAMAEQVNFFKNDPPFMKMMRRFQSVCLVSTHDIPYPFDAVSQLYDRAYTQALEHLLAQGRRSVAMISPHVDLDEKCLTLQRVAKMFTEQGRPVSTRMVRIDLNDRLATMSPPDLHELEHILGQVDTVFCYNDNMAALVMHWLKAKGIRVPEDIAVIGYNDQFMARCMTPPLASIARLDGETVDEVMSLFWERMGDESDPAPAPVRRVVYPRFVPRASAGVLPVPMIEVGSDTHQS